MKNYINIFIGILTVHLVFVAHITSSLAQEDSATTNVNTIPTPQQKPYNASPIDPGTYEKLSISDRIIKGAASVIDPSYIKENESYYFVPIGIITENSIEYNITPNNSNDGSSESNTYKNLYENSYQDFHHKSIDMQYGIYDDNTGYINATPFHNATDIVGSPNFSNIVRDQMNSLGVDHSTLGIITRQNGIMKPSSFRGSIEIKRVNR